VCRGETVYQVYLDLRKAYDSINRAGVLALMEKYGVGPRIRRYVKNIWERQLFMLRQTGFYSDTIPVRRGVTQGDVDSPIIFNLIIDTFLRRAQEEPDFGGSEFSFYADDGLLEMNCPVALQRDLDRVIALFAEFGLIANRMKTKFMILWGPAVAAEKRGYTGRRCVQDPAREPWHKRRVACVECGTVLRQGYLQMHMEKVHQTPVEKYRRRKVGTDATFVVDVNRRGQETQCPVLGCEGRGTNKFTFYRNFAWRHPEATLLVTADGPLPRCQECGMFTRRPDTHPTTTTCR